MKRIARLIAAFMIGAIGEITAAKLSLNSWQFLANIVLSVLLMLLIIYPELKERP